MVLCAGKCNNRLDMWVTGLALLLILISECAGAQQIKLSNIRDNTTVSYPVVLIKGTLDVTDPDLPPSVSWVEQNRRNHTHSIEAINLTSPSPRQIYKAAMYQHNFKVLVELVPGKNQIQLDSSKVRKTLVLNYKPMQAKFRVRFIYMTDKSGATQYPTQEPNDPQDYKNKIDVLAKLMQCFVAEEMNEGGFGRKTFHFDVEANGKARVITTKLPYSREMLSGKGIFDIWRIVHHDISEHMRDEHMIDLVITSFATYDPKRKKAFGYTAAGAPGTAAVTNLGMFSWPSTVTQVPIAFSDTEWIDENLIFNQSGYRDTHWALASTTMGAAFHELGHALFFVHDSDDLCIMSTGYSLFHRQFMVEDSPSKISIFPEFYAHKQEALISPLMLHQMNQHAWIK